MFGSAGFFIAREVSNAPANKYWHPPVLHIRPGLFYDWCLWNNSPSTPHELIWFGVIEVTKPYKFKWFGDIDDKKPYKCIGFRWDYFTNTRNVTYFLPLLSLLFSLCSLSSSSFHSSLCSHFFRFMSLSFTSCPFLPLTFLFIRFLPWLRLLSVAFRSLPLLCFICASFLFPSFDFPSWCPFLTLPFLLLCFISFLAFCLSCHFHFVRWPSRIVLFSYPSDLFQ